MSKRRLLLADDSVTIQKVVNLTFAEEGIEVITAGDGNSAMQKFVEFEPDLVMVDVNMPGFDGYRICEMIKQDDDTKQIPVILLVGSFEPFDEAEARRVGADDYMTKPFQSIRQLVSRVSDLLNRSNGETTPDNQDIYNYENQAAQANVIDSVNYPEMTNAMNFEKFDDAAMDDEMIQTNQIGSLPADESQKFVSESNFQIPENNFNASGLNEKQEVALPTELLTDDYFRQIPVNSTDDDGFRFDEKIFDFADEEPVAQNTAPDVIKQKTQETQEDEKLPEYSTADVKNAVSNAEFNMPTQSENIPIFDFDDLDLLEIPSFDKKPSPVAEQETITEKVSETSETKSVAEKKDSHETANFPPEVIEAIAKRLMEKLSDKVMKEIAQEMTPQAVESVIEELARKKTN